MYSDVINKLLEVMDLAENGELPESAYKWAESAMQTAESIIDAIRKRYGGGTKNQIKALENIEDAADRWLS